MNEPRIEPLDINRIVHGCFIRVHGLAQLLSQAAERQNGADGNGIAVACDLIVEELNQVLDVIDPLGDAAGNMREAIRKAHGFAELLGLATREGQKDLERNVVDVASEAICAELNRMQEELASVAVLVKGDATSTSVVA